MRGRSVALALWLGLSGCPHKPTAPPAAGAPRGLADAGVADPALAALLRDHWEATMRSSPEWATSLGDHRYDEEVSDRSVAAAEARAATSAALLTRARAIDAAGLNDRDRLFAGLLVEALDSDVRRRVCRTETWLMSPRMNALGDLFDVLSQQPLATSADARRWRQRAQAWADSLPGHIEALREGLRTDRVASATSLRLVVAQAEAALQQPASAWAPLDRELDPQLAAGAARDLEEIVRPAAEAWLVVVRDELAPAGRPDTSPGIATLPDGARCYEALIEHYTTLPRTADELHRLGLAELARIHAEMAVVGERALGEPDVPTLISRLRDDPTLKFSDGAEVLATAERALRRAEAAVPTVFGRLPDTRCVVREIPAFEAPYTTIAYYRQPNPDGSKPGEYYVNTYAPETRPRHEAEALAFHESVPGHHLQIALSYESADVPAFVRYDGATAFVEGWGLYAERLADELGLYSGDLDRLGMLSFDTWRASRLVVDTGLHHLGWSREQAVQFMLANTPLAENNIRNEVDRYVTWPGQALAYKTGQIELLALRAEAEAALGSRFDLAAFHDVVLRDGAISMPMLRQSVEAWVAATRAGAP